MFLGRRRGARERGHGAGRRAGFAPVTTSENLERRSGHWWLSVQPRSLLIWAEPMKVEETVRAGKYTVSGISDVGYSSRVTSDVGTYSGR